MSYASTHEHGVEPRFRPSRRPSEGEDLRRTLRQIERKCKQELRKVERRAK